MFDRKEKKIRWEKVSDTFFKDIMRENNLFRFMHYRKEQRRIIAYFNFLRRKYGRDIFQFDDSIIKQHSSHVYIGDIASNGLGMYYKDALDVKEFFGSDFYDSKYFYFTRDDQAELEEVIRRYMMIAHINWNTANDRDVPYDMKNDVMDMLEAAYHHVPVERLQEISSLKYIDLMKYNPEEAEYVQQVVDTPILPTDRLLQLMTAIEGEGYDE